MCKSTLNMCLNVFGHYIQILEHMYKYLDISLNRFQHYFLLNIFIHIYVFIQLCAAAIDYNNILYI